MRKIFIANLLLASALLFSGCQSNIFCPDMIWDFVNYDVAITVSDNNGNDLLDPDNPANIADGMTISYGGKTYEVDNSVREEYEYTKAIKPDWRGLRIRKAENASAYTLLFGEFATGNIKKTTFTINWGDGTTDVAEIDLYVTYAFCEPKVHERISISGHEYSNNSLNAHMVK